MQDVYYYPYPRAVSRFPPWPFMYFDPTALVNAIAAAGATASVPIASPQSAPQAPRVITAETGTHIFDGAITQRLMYYFSDLSSLSDADIIALTQDIKDDMNLWKAVHLRRHS